jgi:hypothetical protein
VATSPPRLSQYSCRKCKTRHLLTGRPAVPRALRAGVTATRPLGRRSGMFLIVSRLVVKRKPPRTGLEAGPGVIESTATDRPRSLPTGRLARVPSVQRRDGQGPSALVVHMSAKTARRIGSGSDGQASITAARSLGNDPCRWGIRTAGGSSSKRMLRLAERNAQESVGTLPTLWFTGPRLPATFNTWMLRFMIHSASSGGQMPEWTMTKRYSNPRAGRAVGHSNRPRVDRPKPECFVRSQDFRFGRGRVTGLVALEKAEAREPGGRAVLGQPSDCTQPHVAIPAARAAPRRACSARSAPQ